MSYTAAAEEDPEHNDDMKTFVKGLDGREKFSPDVYGAFQLMLIRWVNGADDEEELTDGKHKALEAPAFSGVIHTGILALAAVFCQWNAMFLLDVFTISEAADKFQQLNNANFTYDEIVQNLNVRNATAMLNSALAQNSLAPLNNTMGTQVKALCSADGTVPYSLDLFMLIMGIAFVGKLFKHARSIFTHMMQVHSDTSDDLPEDANYWTKNPLDFTGKERLIIYESCLSKMLGICLVKVPDICTTLYLYFVGAQMLCSAPTLYKVVLKSLGITLIFKLPHTIFTFFVEKSIKKMTKKTSVAYKQNKHADHWNTRLFFVPLLKLLFAGVVTTLFTDVQYGDVNDLREACYWYSNTFILPKCLGSWPCGSTFLGEHYFSH